MLSRRCGCADNLVSDNRVEDDALLPWRTKCEKTRPGQMLVDVWAEIDLTRTLMCSACTATPISVLTWLPWASETTG